MNKEKTTGWYGQPSIIKSLEHKFGERTMKERLSLTPGSPRFTARCLEKPEHKLNSEEHETYRSGVGTLLYLTKHSRLDCFAQFLEQYQHYHVGSDSHDNVHIHHN